MDNLSNNSVLVVDDTDLRIEILTSALGSEYNIISASGGKSALQIISDDPPDLVLLDIMMPDMDGYEVCKLLKKDPETKDIPIIFLSARTSLQDKTRGFELGAADYITKPFGISEDDKGKSFDPDLVDVFLDLKEKFRNIAMAFVESDEEREAISIS